MMPTYPQFGTHQYRGRFAPTPSGPLHFGSLLAALGSYLQARSRNGTWLVRIEDIDPPREAPGAAKQILKTLDAYGLHWDETVRYQSQRLARYEDVLSTLASTGDCYGCACTRRQIKARNEQHYDRYCRHRGLPLAGNAIRFCNQHPVLHYVDRVQGEVLPPAAWAAEDFLLRRRDGLIAYQLAVVVDDIEDGISEWVRGADLLLPSCWQLALYDHFQAPRPQLFHLPLMMTADGRKLSKQNHAPALDDQRPVPALYEALKCLGQQPPAALTEATVSELLAWATSHWQPQSVPATLVNKSA